MTLIKSLRPRTLIVTIIPICLCVALASKLNHQINYLYLCLSMIVALLIQMSTNVFNDLIDFERGGDKLRSDRVASHSEMTRLKLRKMAFAFLVISFVLGLPFINLSLWYLPVGIVSLYLTFGYTGGKFSLAYNGLGELFVFIFYGFVINIGAYFAISGILPAELFHLSWISGIHSVFIIGLNNLRDAKEDALIGKKTLVVCLGTLKYKIFLVTCSFILINFYYKLFVNWTFLTLCLLQVLFFILIFKSKSKSEYAKVFKLSILNFTAYFFLALGSFLAS